MSQLNPMDWRLTEIRQRVIRFDEIARAAVSAGLSGDAYDPAEGDELIHDLAVDAGFLIRFIDRGHSSTDAVADHSQPQ